MKRLPHGNTKKYDGQINFLGGNFISNVGYPPPPPPRATAFKFLFETLHVE